MELKDPPLLAAQDCQKSHLQACAKREHPVFPSSEHMASDQVISACPQL